ncbi:MAG: Gluconokinase [uncultured Rubrobacteraceae bacterium]|uniref:Gluconokinase n=1 Tax=uncultured Rubrobacteraceae bacterium TaxID=349277 RepID=A0A6J4SCW4_9ACTN|nr:MAG: Gluconokinase [uncultured Rubrobacteraceae bacterium]
MSSLGNILSIDIGSSSVRCSVYDEAGAPMEDTASAHRHAFERGPDGTAILKAEDLSGLVYRTIDETLEKARRAGIDISAVATSAFWHGLLGVDARGRPTTPIFTWADRRAAGEARELRRRLDEKAVHRRTGAVLHSSFWPAKLLWLSRTYPEEFSRTTRFLSPDEYLQRELFGEARVGTSMASGTGLFDQNRRTWDEDLLAELPIDGSRLSPISDEPLGGTVGAWARRWPVLRDVPWFPGAGDGACSNVGSGCTDTERLAVMVGTSGAMRILWEADSAEVPEGLWCYRADARRFVAGGALSDGGNLIEWLRETLRLPDEAETEFQLSRMEPDAHGLTLLPLLAGERGPNWADQANGTVAGLSLSTRPVEILRAAMEAVALRFALIAERLDAAFPEGTKGRQVVATGGGLLNSPTWVQIMADALGRPVTVSGVKEASSRGAALLAAEALGGQKIGEVEAPLGETYHPAEGRYEIYQQALERQRSLYGALMEREAEA